MIRRILTILVSLLILLGIAAYVKKEQIKQYALASLTEYLESSTGCRVACSDIHLSLPLRLRVGHLWLLSSDLPLFDLTDLEMQISLWDLIHRQLVIKKIQIGSLAILNPPPNQKKSPSALQWTALPPSISVELVDIRHFTVSGNILEALGLKKYVPDIPLQVVGSGKIDTETKNMLFDFSLAHALNGAHKTHIELFLAQQDDVIETETRVTFSNSPLLSEGSSLHGIILAKAPTTSWKNLLSQKDVVDSVEGEFQMLYSELVEESKNEEWASVEGKFSYSSIEGIEIRDMEGMTGPLILRGKAMLSPEGHLDGTWLTLQMPIVPYLDNDIEARGITAFCKLSGNLFLPQISLQLHADKIFLDPFSIDACDVVAEGKWNPHHFQGEIQGQLNLNDHPISLSSTIGWQGEGVMTLSYLKASSGVHQLKCDQLHLDLLKQMITGTISGTLDLALLHPHAKGIADFSLLCHPIENGMQAIECSLNSFAAQFDELFMSQTTLTAQAFGRLNRPFELANKIQLKAHAATYRDWTAKQLIAETDFFPNRVASPFSIACELGKDEAIASVQTQGAWSTSSFPRTLYLDLHSLSGRIQDLPFALQEPLRAQISRKHLSFTPFFLTCGSGSISGACALESSVIRTTCQVKQLPLKLVRLLSPDFSLDGFVSGELKFSNVHNKLIGKMKLDFDQLVSQDERIQFPSPVNAILAVNLQEEELSTSGQVLGMGQQPIAFHLNLPIYLTLSPFECHVEKTHPIAGEIWAKGRLESLLELLLPATAPNITGDGDVAIELTGTLDAPQVHGKATLANATFELPYLGLSFVQLQAQIFLNGTTATLTHLDGSDGKDGRVTGNGKISLDAAQGFPFDIGFHVEHSYFQPSDYAEATANADLRLRGDARGSLLEGNFTADEVKIKMPNRISALARSVEVHYVNQPSHQPSPTRYSPPPSQDWPLVLNVEINDSGNTKITGTDWTSQWKGHLMMTGTKDAPLYNGSYTIVNGEYKYNGKAFHIREGTITFNGDLDKKTNVYVVASRDMDALTADIVLKGPMNNPGITFRSNPPMSQREILSWILFDTGMTDITPFQGNQLNESITELNLESDKPDMLTRIRNRIGIDKIDISRSHPESNEVSLQVGKYISRGLLISIQKSVTAESNRVGIEADLINNFKAQAEIGDNAEGQLHLKWKKDY